MTDIVPSEYVDHVKALKRLAEQGLDGWTATKSNVLLVLPLGYDEPPATERAKVERREALRELLPRVPEDRYASRSDQHRCAAILGVGEYRGKPWNDRKLAIAKHYPPAQGVWRLYQKEPFDRDLLAIFETIERLASRRDLQMSVIDPDGYIVIEQRHSIDLESQTTRVFRRLRVTRDEKLEAWEGLHFTRDLGDPMNSEIAVEGPGNAEIDAVSGQDHGFHGQGYLVRYRFPVPLAIGDEAEFTVVRREVIGEQTDGSCIQDRHAVPRQTVEHLAMDVRFPPGRASTEVRQIADAADWTLKAHRLSGPVIPVVDGVARYEWTPKVGRAYGIAWRR